jgi:hypothetical protein
MDFFYTFNTELTIHALNQVHCWDAYFRLWIGHYENFTPLNYHRLLLTPTSYLYYYIRLLMSLISLFFFALIFGKPLNYFTCEKEDF